MTEATVGRLIDALASGQSRRTAATMAGVSQSALFRWMAIGREDAESPEGDLVRRVEQAEQQFIGRQINRIDQAADEGNWTAAAWLAERKDPENWARKSRVQVDHALAAPAPDPSIGSTSAMMMTVVLQLANNPDVSTWPEPMRLAYESMIGQPAPTIDGEAKEAEAVPAQAEAAAAGDLF